MPTIIKEPFAPRKRHFMLIISAYRALGVFYRRLNDSAPGFKKFAKASLRRSLHIGSVTLLLFTTLLPPSVLL